MSLHTNKIPKMNSIFARISSIDEHFGEKKKGRPILSNQLSTIVRSGGLLSNTLYEDLKLLDELYHEIEQSKKESNIVTDSSNPNAFATASAKEHNQ
jgi:hypothetical protein